MKLSEYLHNKMGPSNAITWRARTAEQIEEFLQEWASETRATSYGKPTKIRDYCDDDEYKKFWTCKICKRDTSTVDYDYLVANDLHLECALKKEMVSVEYTWRDE